jgi:hypothetical protein
MFKREFDANQEKRYIQSACETTVTSYFAQRFPKSFRYEPRLNATNDTNVECQFRLVNYDYTINVEVKCPNFDRLEAQDLANRFHLNLPVRMDRGFIDPLLQSLNKVTSDEGLLEYAIPHRMDNNLKDYLLSASKKFKDATAKTDINILVVCCDNAKSMQEFFNYLFQPGGFFDEDPNPTILTKSEYKNVDVVILCNLYYRHRHYFNKPNIAANWDFSKAFNLIFDNHNREFLEPKATGIDFIRNHILANDTVRLFDFINEGELTQLMGQEFPDEFLVAIGLEYYVASEALKGVIHF